MNNYEFLGGFISYLFYYVYNSSYLFVCGDDRVNCDPGAAGVTSEPGDA